MITITITTTHHSVILSIYSSQSAIVGILMKRTKKRVHHLPDYRKKIRFKLIYYLKRDVFCARLAPIRDGFSLTISPTLLRRKFNFKIKFFLNRKLTRRHSVNKNNIGNKLTTNFPYDRFACFVLPIC